MLLINNVIMPFLEQNSIFLSKLNVRYKYRRFILHTKVLQFYKTNEDKKYTAIFRAKFKHFFSALFQLRLG